MCSKTPVTDNAVESAYYRIVTGGHFVVGFKYAGMARQEAYRMIIKDFDSFSRMAYSSICFKFIPVVLLTSHCFRPKLGSSQASSNTFKDDVAVAVAMLEQLG